MTTFLNTSLNAKTALLVSAGCGVRAGRVGTPEAFAMAGGAAVSHGVRMTDRNLHALAARCAR